MADYTRKPGATSNIFLVFIGDSSVSTGAGKTGLVYNTASLTAYYKRDSATAGTAITLATISTFGTFTSGGFKEIDATNMKGLYEFHPPDAGFVAGAKSLTFVLQGATGMRPCIITVDLDAGRVVVGYQKNTAFKLYFQMVDASGNGVPLLVDGDFTVKQIDMDGAGSPAILTGTITEGGPGPGWYWIPVADVEAVFDDAALEFRAPGCVPTKLTLHLNT